MKIAVLSDIHGNKHALEEVIKDSSRRGVEKYIILGDLFVHGGCPREVLDILQEMPIISSVMGNHEYYVTSNLIKSENGLIMGKPANHDSLKELIAAEKWWLDQVGDVGIEFLKLSGQSDKCCLESQNIFCCHASPWDYELAPSPENIELVNKIEVQLDELSGMYLSGHTHVPHFIKGNRVKFINPGSVGLSIDGDNRASYCIFTLNDTSYDVHFLRVSYDVDGAISAITNRGVPLGSRTIKILQSGFSQLRK
jgi:predicted phosphodiesterase